MPGQNFGWFHDSQTFPPAIPEAAEQYPEDTIDRPEPGARCLMNEARELVAQRNILGSEIRAAIATAATMEKTTVNLNGIWQITVRIGSTLKPSLESSG